MSRYPTGGIYTAYHNSSIDNRGSNTININGNQNVNSPSPSPNKRPRSSPMQGFDDGSFMDDAPSYDPTFAGSVSSAFVPGQQDSGMATVQNNSSYTPPELETTEKHKQPCTVQLHLPSFKDMSLDDALLYCDFKGQSTGPLPPVLISPWKNPSEWIDAHLTHLKGIVQDLGKLIGPGKLDTHIFDKNQLIYPRTIMYLLVHLSRCAPNNSRLVKFSETCQRWKASDSVSLMVNQSTIKDTLTKRLGQLDTEHLDTSVFQRLLSLDTIHLSAQLALLVNYEPTIRAMVSKRGQEAQSLINLLHSRLDYDVETEYRPRHVKALNQLCKKAGLYPQGLILDDKTSELGFPVSRGGFAFVHHTKLRGHTVAVKLLAAYSDRQQALKDFTSEAVVWLHMDHQRILPFYGLYSGERGVGFVSPWMEQGHIVKFLTNHPDTNCLYLAEDIIDGLEYLHDMDIVHGDLKGLNILVTEGGHACLADFGLATMVDNGSIAFTKTQVPDSKSGGTLPYMAPELHGGGKVNYESDIYAFACVCYEMLSGHAPFHHHLNRHNTSAIESQVMKGGRPAMPEGDGSRIRGLTTEWWKLITDCWAHDPHKRPSASTVRGDLRELPGRKGDMRNLGDIDEITKAKREFRRKEDNPFAPILPGDEDHYSPFLYELKDALILGMYY